MDDASNTSIAGLRKSLGLTLEEFAGRIGLKSKGQASEIERTEKCSPEVALEIERLSAGTINASALNATVAAARQGLAA